MEIFGKALNSLTGTGNQLIPEFIDPYITELSRKLSPLRQVMPSMQVDNETFTYKRRNNTHVGQSLGENDTWAFQSGGYDSHTISMKIVGALGGVSNLLQEGTQRFFNALQGEVDSAVRGCVKYEEHLLLNGSIANNAKQFDGVAAQLSTNTGYSGQISFNMLDAMDDAVKARGFGIDPESCYWVTTPNMSTNIARLTQPYFRQDGNPMNLVGGFSTSVYRNHKILESSAAEVVNAVSNEAVTITSKVGTLGNPFVINAAYDDQLGNVYNAGASATAPVVSVGGSVVNSGYSIAVDPFVGTSVITFTATPSGAVTVSYFWKQQNIYLLDFSTMKRIILHDLAFEALPDPVQQDQKVFRVKAYEALAVEAEIGNAWASNVHG